MTFRFIHTSDLHLGRKFANIPQPHDGNMRGRLMEARHAALGRIASAARAHGAGHILVAGDTFDTPTPSLPIVRQALAAMAEDAALVWWLLPGNHDNLREAEPLWDLIRREAAANVRCLVTPEPVSLSAAATLLPCPVEWRSSGADPTAQLAAMPSAQDTLRIGLAHGAVTDFTDTGAHIPPDRDRTARLEYLALGDWHGRLEISPRVFYSGSPEQDRFRHGRRGVCLAVEIAGPGAVPVVADIETGTFIWSETELALSPRQDAAAALADSLPADARRDRLVRITATGWATLSEQVSLKHAGALLGSGFGHFELRTDTLGTQYDVADLDAIDRGGALRLAADALKAEFDDAALARQDRDVAADALARLYAYVREDAQ
jgi:DNA repair exonuclease SbcCD nuclease subunit